MLVRLNPEQVQEYQDFARDHLGFEFHDISLFITALTHRSYVNEHKHYLEDHNERLEFLGDAVLEVVVSDFLYRNYDQPEGIMTSWRSALVRTESNCEAGREIGYEHLVRLSRGERRGTERAHASILADCFEAVIGAVYIDQGYAAAKKIIDEHILNKMDQILEEGSWRDPKSYFQELVQHIDVDTPRYRTIKEEGPDHDKTFTIAVFVGKKMLGRGVGHSKQDAQVIAAKQGIKYYKDNFPEEAEAVSKLALDNSR